VPKPGGRRSVRSGIPSIHCQYCAKISWKIRSWFRGHFTGSPFARWGGGLHAHAPDPFASVKGSVNENVIFAEKGRPLGRVSTRQKSFCSQIFRWVDSLLPADRFRNPSFEPFISSLISDASRRAIACAKAIRSVTHLVLAPKGKPEQSPHFEPKERAGGRAPPARFFCRHLLSSPGRPHRSRLQNGSGCLCA
jgi:hypothetical protein